MKQFAVLLLVMLAGCKGASEAIKAFPSGTQIQSSTTGIRIAPAAVDGNPFSLGTHTFSISTPNPSDSGPSLNRYAVKAPLGVELKSTVASGPIGTELQKAGPEIMRSLTGTESANSLESDPAKVTKPPAEIDRSPQAKPLTK